MILIVEGCIGAGKSTFRKHLALAYRDLGYTVETDLFDEGVDSTPMKDLFELYCTDVPKYCFALQSSFFSRLYYQLQMAVKLKEQGVICILERSLFGNNVFTCLHYRLGNLSLYEFNILQGMITNYPYIEQADHLIYIDTSNKVCMERQKLRLRKGEEIYDDNYNRKLKDVYGVQLHRCIIPYTKVDWNFDLVECLDKLDNLINDLHSINF